MLGAEGILNARVSHFRSRPLSLCAWSACESGAMSTGAVSLGSCGAIKHQDNVLELPRDVSYVPSKRASLDHEQLGLGYLTGAAHSCSDRAGREGHDGSASIAASLAGNGRLMPWRIATVGPAQRPRPGR